MSNGNIGGRESLKKYKRESTKKVWKRQWASRKHRKGRASGRMLMEVKKNWETRGVEGTREEKEEEGIIVIKVDIEGEEWRIIEVYVNGDMERKIN